MPNPVDPQTLRDAVEHLTRVGFDITPSKTGSTVFPWTIDHKTWWVAAGYSDFGMPRLAAGTGYVPKTQARRGFSTQGEKGAGG